MMPDLDTPVGPLTAPRATLADCAAVLELQREAARWAEARGIVLWRDQLGKDGLAHVQRRFREGEIYLFRRGTDLVATLTLQWADKFMWGERGEDGQAGYVHGLTVRRDLAGRGLGAWLLGWAARKTAEQGVPLLRLDTSYENARLRRYYVEQGFTEVGERQAGPHHLALFERPVAVGGSSAAGLSGMKSQKGHTCPSDASGRPESEHRGRSL